MATKLGGEVLWLCPSISDSANDLSGQGNNGTYNGGMGTVSDVSNGGTRAYSCDGSDDYINIPIYGGPFGDNSRTYCGWIKKPDFSAYGILFSSGAFVARQYLAVLVHGAGGYGGGANGSIGLEAYTVNLITNSYVAVNAWSHICVTYSGGSAIAYYNGSLCSPVVIENIDYLDTQNTSVQIGARPSPSPAYSNDRYDDLRIFNRVLTQAEITKLASKRGYQPAANNMMMGVGL